MGGAVLGSGSSCNLPYGVDPSCIGSIMDRAICRLPKRRKEVIMLEYRRVGTQALKAKGMGIALKTYENHLAIARTQLAMQPDVKKLLKRC